MLVKAWVIALCITSFASSFNITKGKLVGVISSGGIGNVRNYIESVSIPESQGNVTCTKNSTDLCPACPSGSWLFDSIKKAFRCVCMFDFEFQGTGCKRISLSECTEAVSSNLCGFTWLQARMYAQGFMRAFSYTLGNRELNYFQPIDVLDAFAACQSINEFNGGFYPLNLEICLRWVKRSVVSFPEAYMHFEKTSAVNTAAKKMKAMVGYWQFPVVYYSGNKIFVKDHDMTEAVTNVLKTMFESDWDAFGEAVGVFIKSVPADYDLTLPLGDSCPPTWWSCLTSEKSVVLFNKGVLEGLNLPVFTQSELQDITDEGDISYLYQFYNSIVYQNFKSGFLAKDVKESLLSLFKAVKSLTDGESSTKNNTANIAKLAVMMKPLSEPRVVISKGGVYLNGRSIWSEFGSTYFLLADGYITEAGHDVGKIILVLNKPLSKSINSKNIMAQEDVSYISRIKAQKFFIGVLAAFTDSSGNKESRRRLALTLSAECLDEGVDLAEKSLDAWEKGYWSIGLWQGIQLVCQAMDTGSACSDSLDVPDDLEYLCDIAEDLPELLLNEVEYIFSYFEKNVFGEAISIANNIFSAFSDEIEDLVEEAGAGLGIIGKIFLSILSGKILTAVFAFLCIASYT